MSHRIRNQGLVSGAGSSIGDRFATRDNYRCDASYLSSLARARRVWFTPPLTILRNRDSGNYLSEALSALGLRYDLQMSADTVEQKVDIANCIYDLVRERQRAQQYREEVSTEIKRFKSQNSELKRSLESTKERLNKSRKKQWLAEEKLRNFTKEARASETALKQKVKKLTKEATMVKNRDKGYLAKIRKVEAREAALRERLAKAQRGRTSSSKGAKGPKIEILNAIKTSSRRAPAKKGTGELQLLRDTLVTYEKKSDSLMDENARLRSALEGFEQKLDKVLNKQETDLTLSKSVQDALAEFNPGQFQMPMGTVESLIEQGLTAQLVCLRERMEEMDRTAMGSEQETTERLAEIIQEQRSLLLDQDWLLRASLQPRARPAGTPLGSPKSTPKGTPKRGKRGRRRMSIATQRDLEDERQALSRQQEKYVQKVFSSFILLFGAPNFIDFSFVFPHRFCKWTKCSGSCRQRVEPSVKIVGKMCYLRHQTRVLKSPADRASPRIWFQKQTRKTCKG